MGILGIFKKQKTTKTIAEFYFSVDSGVCGIEMGSKYSDEIFIEAFILFLSRYLFICDDRQLSLMRKLLLRNITDDYDFQAFEKNINDVGSTIYNSLTNDEKDQLKTLSSLRQALPVVVSSSLGNGALGSYEFYIVNSKVGLGSIFNMSEGLDIVILPRLLVLFYDFVWQNISAENNKKKLNKATRLFLTHCKKDEDYREEDVFVSLPQEIVRIINN